MKTSIKKSVKKTVAVSLAAAMAFSVSPLVKADAKVKAPSITPKVVVIVKGESKTLKIKKGTYKIKSVKWTSKNKKIATVNKNGKVTAKDYGNAKIQAIVTTEISAKKTKKYTLTRKVEVIEDGEPNEPDAPSDTWIIPDATITEGVTAKFDIINKELDGASYKPFALIGIYFGSDNVNKWRVLSKKSLITANPTSTYVVTEISEDGSGAVKLEKVVETGLSVLPSPAEAPSGGWSECEDPAFTPKEAADIDSKLNPEDLVGGTAYNVVAKIGSQIVAGANYKVIVEKHTAGIANPVSSYVIIDVFCGLDGTVTPDLSTAISIEM